jgi:hypothetical protein
MNQFEQNHLILQQSIDQANHTIKKKKSNKYYFNNIHVFRKIIVVVQCLLMKYIMNLYHDLIVDFV